MKTRSVGFELCHADGRGGYDRANSRAQLNGLAFTPDCSRYSQPTTHFTNPFNIIANFISMVTNDTGSGNCTTLSSVLITWRIIHDKYMVVSHLPGIQWYAVAQTFAGGFDSRWELLEFFIHITFPVAL